MLSRRRAEGVSVVVTIDSELTSKRFVAIVCCCVVEVESLFTDESEWLPC